MMKNFLAYDLALQLYRQCQTVQAKYHLKDQLNRASLSVVLNLAEGAGKRTPAEQRHFYSNAMGSLRETQAIIQILDFQAAVPVAHRLGGMVYRLVNRK